MKSRASLRLMPFVVLVVLVLGLAAQNSQAQTVSFSPVALSYGVPTGTPGTPPASGQETLTVNILGATPSTPVTFGSTTKTGTYSSDFIVAGDSCAGQTFTSPGTCLVILYFNASLVPATTLETATLTITPSTGSLIVPLSGAYGSIKLWDETDVATSFGTVNGEPIGYTNMYTISSKGLNLSCPASPTAKLSNTPDGNGYVLVDNYLTLAINGAAVNGSNVGSTNYPPGNVCSGGETDVNGGNTYDDCFSASYEGAASGLIGQDPDTFTNPGNSVLTGGNAGGIPPINVSTFFSTGTVPATLTALDAGGELTSSTLFLATSCSPGGLVPGGSVTGNPTPTNTASFDSNPGSNFSLADSSAQNPPPTGTTPVYTQIAVPQQLFQQLVAGTSAAPDVCFRLTSELDYSVNPPAPMCAGVLIQCWDSTHTTLSGANCDPSTPSLLRDLYFSMSFDSPDGPVNGTNYLYNSPTNACSYYLSNQTPPVAGGACANSTQTGFTGPGLLLGADQWLCAPGSTKPPNSPGGCTPLEPNTPYAPPLTEFNTQTSPSVTIYSSSQSANCDLSGLLTGDLCPLDTLTQFRGAADLPPTGAKGNSTYIPVANHPLPTATATIAGQNASGWINTSTITATFNSNEAIYAPGLTNPPANTFTAAPIYSLTYGISTWPALPDTTYPVAGDVTNYPASGVTPNFGAPLCTSAPSSFASNSTGNPNFSGLSNGIYNVHYFPTDCALTEGLVFNPTNLTDPTVNWASFPFVTVGIDTVDPTLTSCTPPTPTYLGGGGWYGKNITVPCTVTDQSWLSGVTGSGFLPLLSSSIQGSQTEAVNVYTNVAPNTTNGSAVAGAQIGYPPTGTGTTPSPLTVTDLAGNPVVGGVSAGPYQIDLQAPTISGPTLSPAASGNNYVVGSVSTVTISYSCTDGGSGVASCTEVGALPSGTTCSGTTAVTCTFAPAPTNVGAYSIYVSAVDNVGNAANSSATPLKFSVSDAPATVIFGALPASTVTPGNSLTYYVGAVDVNPAKNPVSVYGANISVTLKMASGTLSTTTAPTAISDVVACTSWPCTVTPTTGTPCSVSSTATTVSISCNVGTIADIFTAKSAVMVKIVVPTSKTAPAGSIAASGTITAATPLSGITTFKASISVK